jgi:hypothetical protein
MEKILTYIDTSRDPYRRPTIIPNNLLEKSIEDYHKSKDLWSLQKSIYSYKVNMNFSEALIKLKEGCQVKRKDWNSYLRLGNEEVPEILYKTLTKEQKDLLYTFIKDGKSYTVTKEDILAEDWHMINFNNDFKVTKNA